MRADPARFRDLDANPSKNPQLTATLAEAAQVFVDNAPALLGAPVTLDDDGVATLARALTRERRDAWLSAPDAASAEGVFFNAIVHASAFVGEVIARAHGGAWELRRPMWESVVRRRRRGAVAPFHWMLRSLADDAIDDAPLAYRWRVHVVMASATPDALPVVTELRGAKPCLKVLSKSDLADPEVTEGWLRYFESGRAERAGEAEAVYREDLGLGGRLPRAQVHPDNVWALRGLLDCLVARGETVEAAVIRQKLDFAAARADMAVMVSCFCATTRVEGCCE